MAEVVRVELATVDPAEVSDYLLERYGAATDIRTWLADDGLHVVAFGKTTATMTAYLDAFRPASTIDRAAGTSSYRPPAHPALRAHLAHLESYLKADPAQIAHAHTVHVVKDLIRALFREQALGRDPAAVETGGPPVVTSGSV